MKKLLSILMLLVAIVTGAKAADLTNPATVVKDNITFLNVAGMDVNVEGTNYLAINPTYWVKKSGEIVPAWMSNSAAGSNSSSVTATGFLPTGSSYNDINKAYGYLNAKSNAACVFYVTGIEGTAILGQNNSSTRKIQLSVQEYDEDNKEWKTATVNTGTSTSAHVIPSTATFSSSKYYKITVDADNDQNNRFYQIRLTKPSAPATAYTVTFNAGDHGTYTGGDIKEASAGAGITLPALTSLADGYIFNGWFTDATGGEKAGDAGKNYKPSADNTPLYAQYSEIPTPTFELSATSIEVGQTAQIKVTGKDDLDGVALTDLTYDDTKISISAAGVVTALAAGADCSITFNSSAVAGKYKASSVTSDNPLTITVTAPKCATPTISPVSFSTDNQEVTITSATDGATIYYTTDGTDPTESSNVYEPESKPTISSTTTFKAIAVKENYDDSEVATQKVTRTSSAVVANWNFTNWSAATQAGVKGDTEAWSQYEKTNSGGMDFGENGRSHKGAISSGSTLKYNETNNIDETNGLTFAADAYDLALIFNIGSATVSKKEYTYHGSSYLWLYNGNAIITIPSVPAGATIEIGVESHNGGTERGVTLKNGSTTLEQTQGEEASKVYQVCKWTNATAGNVTVTPSAGLHIYYITVTSNVETEGITTDNGVATYVTKNALDFTGLETKAYVVKSVDTKKNKVFTEEVTTVPAGTALLVKGATVNVPVIASATAPATNLLQISNGSVTGAAGNIFAYSKSSKQFKKVASSVTIPSGKCYLEINGGTESLDVDFEDEATAVEAIAEADEAAAAPIKVIKGGKLYIGNYNVAGQLVK